LEEVLGFDYFNEEIKDAWNIAYTQLVKVMIGKIVLHDYQHENLMKTTLSRKCFMPMEDIESRLTEPSTKFSTICQRFDGTYSNFSRKGSISLTASISIENDSIHIIKS
jgi:hypothetical protein